MKLPDDNETHRKKEEWNQLGVWQFWKLKGWVIAKTSRGKGRGDISCSISFVLIVTMSSLIQPSFETVISQRSVYSLTIHRTLSRSVYINKKRIDLVIGVPYTGVNENPFLKEEPCSSSFD
jgi:hypothetical protein